MRAQIPDGLAPGQQFQVQVPTAPAPVAVAAAAPMAMPMAQPGVAQVANPVAQPGMAMQPGMMPMGVPPDPSGFNTMSPLEFMLGMSQHIAVAQQVELFEAISGCAIILSPCLRRESES